MALLIILLLLQILIVVVLLYFEVLMSHLHGIPRMKDNARARLNAALREGFSSLTYIKAMTASYFVPCYDVYLGCKKYTAGFINLLLLNSGIKLG